MNHKPWSLAMPVAVLSAVLACAHSAAAPTGPETVTVHPRQTDELLANPGMGWQTFHRFSDDDTTLDGLPSASAYFRFYWREIEPEDGEIDFAKFDELLAHGGRVGQKLAFRVMCTGSGEYMDVPAWLKEKGCKGVEFTYGGRRHWIPDFADTVFQQSHSRLIRELGRRYDGHPNMDLLDIGSVGLWGEWHMGDTKALDTGKPVPLPSLEICHAIIDAWRAAFPKSEKVILIGSEEGMTRAEQDGCGWRADCLGDMGGFSKTWNHMENFYRQQLEKTGAENAWKKAPVAFESCWDMRKWKQENWDISFIFDYALNCHASYMNNKSAPIPNGTRREVERFLMKLGYRLAARDVKHSSHWRAGTDTSVSILWENIGVAPPYRDYRVAVRLKGTPEKEGFFTCSETSIRGWLPGERLTELSFGVPESLAPGRYELAIAVVDPANHKPSVQLAIAGRDAEGWYPISHVDVTR